MWLSPTRPGFDSRIGKFCSDLSVSENVTFGRNKVLNAVCKKPQPNTKRWKFLVNKIPVGLAVRLCGFHPQGQGSTPGLEILFRFSILETTLHLAVTKYSIPSAQTATKHQALEILINYSPVGLAVRICGLDPQGTGSTPGLGKFVRIRAFQKTTLRLAVTKFSIPSAKNRNQTRGAGNSCK